MLPTPVSLGRPGAGKQRHLVGRGVEHARIVEEDVLRAIAVMHVEIDDGDALGAELALRLARHDGDGVDEAEPHRPLALGVVAGRAHARRRHCRPRPAPPPRAPSGPAPSAVATASSEPAEMKVSSSIGTIPSAGRMRAPAPADSPGRARDRRASDRRSARRGAKASAKSSPAQRLLDGADAVGALGMPRRGHVALKIALADEKCRQCLKLRRHGFLDALLGPCQTALHERQRSDQPEIAPLCRAAARRRGRRLSHRDGLRARRRRDQFRRRAQDLRDQGPAALQPADRPRRRPGDGANAGGIFAAGRKAGGILAGPADPGAAEAGRTPGSATS